MNDKQRRFAQEYVVDHNAKQAAIRAGYSQKTAEVTGCRLLRHVKVSTLIRQIEAETTEKLNITVEMIANGLHKEATDKENPGATRAQAWAHLAKWQGMFVDKVEHSGEMTQHLVQTKPLAPEDWAERYGVQEQPKANGKTNGKGNGHA